MIINNQLISLEVEELFDVVIPQAIRDELELKKVHEREKRKQYRLKHKESISLARKKYYLKNKEILYLKNRKRILEKRERMISSHRLKSGVSNGGKKDAEL